jgi:RNA polymerase sigma factor (sigma-70 family)
MADINGYQASGAGKGETEPTPSFEEDYRLCYPQVVRHLTYLLGSRAAAEDVAQETFLKLYTVPPPVRDNLAGWLQRVSARLAFNYLRGEKRRARREEAVHQGNDVIPLEERFWRDQQAQVVRQLLQQLPDRERMALLLRYSGFAYREIAQAIEVSPASVGTLLARSQKRLLAKYRQRMGDER